MKKYFIGIVVISLLSVGLIGYTVVQGLATRKDTQTEKKAQEVASALNDYADEKGAVPESLDELDVEAVPDTIAYEQTGPLSYTFCVNYDQDSGSYSGIGPQTVLFGAGYEGYDYYSSYYEENESSYLYLPSTHKAGETCYKIRTYGSYNSNSYPALNSSEGSLFSNSSSFEDSARDTERQTDIGAIYAQLELYYTDNAHYPTLEHMNDSSFVSSNLSGLDNEALIDPSGFMAQLANEPQSGSYSYEPTSVTGGDCDNETNLCLDYTLTATLESGEVYTKTAL